MCRDVSGENKGGLSAAVDNILNLTCTEPAFEGLLPVPLDQGEETALSSTLFTLSPLAALMVCFCESADPTHHPPHPSSSQSSHPLPPHSSGQVSPLQDNPQWVNERGKWDCSNPTRTVVFSFRPVDVTQQRVGDREHCDEGTVSAVKVKMTKFHWVFSRYICPMIDLPVGSL